MLLIVRKALLVAGALAGSVLLCGTGIGSAQAQEAFCSANGTLAAGTFVNQSLCAYAWQSVAVGGGMVSAGSLNIPAGPSYTTTPVAGPGSFQISFSVPNGAGGGWSFANPTTTEAFASGSCASDVPLWPTPAGSPSNAAITYTVYVPSSVTVPAPCTVELGPTQISGVGALAKPVYSCLGTPNSNPLALGDCSDTPPNSILVCEDVFNQSGLSSVVAQANSPCPLTTTYALSSSQLGFTTNAPANPLVVNIGAVDAEHLCLGTGWSQTSGSLTCDAVADIGSLDVFTNDYSEADGESVYLFSPGNMTVQIYGNYSGIASAALYGPYAAPTPGCTGTAASTAIPSANLVTFTIPTITTDDASAYYEICLTAAGGGAGAGPIIGANFNGFGGPGLPDGSPANNSSAPLITLPGAPTPTVQSALGNALAAYGYNGILQPINASWAGNPFLDPYIRIVNNTAEPIQVFADVQADNGSLGTAVVESNLPGNTNDYVPIGNIAAAAGVTPDAAGHVSVVLAIPFPAAANPPEGGSSSNTVSSGTGASGSCIPNTSANANGSFTASNGLCFVGISQVVGESGDSLWLNLP